MNKAVLYFVLLFVIFRPGIIAQDFFGSVSYIPMVGIAWYDATLNNCTPCSMKVVSTPLLKQMGLDAMVVQNFDTQMPNWSTYFNGIQMLHYRFTDENSNYIVKYTGADYTRFWANPAKETLGLIRMNVDPLYTTIASDNTVKCEGTHNGTFLTGPIYYQRPKYTEIDDNLITHKIKFAAKFTKTRKFPQNVTDLLEVAVTVFHVSNNNSRFPLSTKVFSSMDVDQKNGWDNWVDYELPTYQLSNVTDSEGDEYSRHPIEGPDPIPWLANSVEFRFTWKGTDECAVYIDSIITWDQNGFDIMYSNYARTNVCTTSSTFNYQTMGWYGIEEPKSIDNYHPFYVVNNLIKEANSNTRFLHTCITPGWLKKYGNGAHFSWNISPFSEFQARAQLEEVHANLYHLGYPFMVEHGLPQCDTKFECDLLDLQWATDNLDTILKLNVPFSFSVYGGKTIDYTKDTNGVHLFYEPSPAEFLYTHNLGLIYGAQAIWYDGMFSNNDRAHSYVQGLFDHNYQTTWKYNLIKDVISPRLKGEFGQTLRKLKRYSVSSKLSVTQSILNEDFSQLGFTVFCSNTSPNRLIDVEAADLEESNNEVVKYAMVVNRAYSSTLNTDMSIIFKDLSDCYTNYHVKEIVTGIESIVRRLPGNESTPLNFILSPGEAALFKVYPEYYHDGHRRFVYPEQISDQLEVNEGDTLTISSDLTLLNGADLINHGTVIFEDDLTLLPGTGSNIFNYGTITMDGFDEQSSTVKRITVQFPQNLGYIKNFDTGVIDLRFVDIINGEYGLWNLGGATRVSGCTFTNMLTGIYNYGTVNRSVHENVVLQTSISNTTIGYYAINAKAKFLDCTINDNEWGVLSANQSFLQYTALDTNGNNCLYENLNPGIVSLCSTQLLGNSIAEPSFPGMNGLFNNVDYELSAHYNSLILGHYTYWDGNPLMNTIIDTSSEAYFNPYLLDRPCQGSQQSIRGNGSTLQPTGVFSPGILEDTLLSAISDIMSGKPLLGINKCRSILQNGSNHLNSLYAVLFWHFATIEYAIPGFEEEITGIVNCNAKNPAALATELLLSRKNPENRLQTLNRLLEKYAGSPLQKMLFFEKITDQLYRSRDSVEALAAYTQLQTLYPESPYTRAAGLHFRSSLPHSFGQQLSVPENQLSPVPSEYALLGNFPNPFNMEMIIRYALPVHSEVTIEIYDINGVLMKQHTIAENAGYKEYRWNGTDQQERKAASGVYLYRFRARATDGSHPVYGASGKAMLVK